MKVQLGESPMTDPRSLMISLTVNGLMLFVASMIVIGVVQTTQPDPPSTFVRGELEPVDTVAPPDSGGGAPGELGGVGMVLVKTDSDGSSVPFKDSPADALLAELLPSRPQNELSNAMTGPSMSGLGAMPGLESGGGGGRGSGTGRGQGTGVGPGTEFFGVRENAGSFAYVIDCSGSMALRGALDRAKAELLASLARLPPEASFGVIFYNLRADVFTDVSGKIGLMPATPANKERVRTLLSRVVPDGGTDHMGALLKAFSIHPEVVFYLSDGDLMSSRDVQDLQAQSGEIRIQAVEFGLGRNSLRSITPLRKLATESGGSYRYIDTSQFAPK